MFDWYEPDPAVACPRCGEPVDAWQGKDGPRALFVWRQGVAPPIAHRVDEEARLDPEELAGFRLPPVFTIAGYCPNGHESILFCRCTDGVWTHARDGDPYELIRFWFEFDVSEPGPPAGAGMTIDGGTFAHRFLGCGVGVTAYDRSDACWLIEQALDGEPLPPIVREERNPDLDALTSDTPGPTIVGHRTLGVPVWRGIWFPPINRSGPATRHW